MSSISSWQTRKIQPMFARSGLSTTKTRLLWQSTMKKSWPPSQLSNKWKPSLSQPVELSRTTTLTWWCVEKMRPVPNWRLSRSTNERNYQVKVYSNTTLSKRRTRVSDNFILQRIYSHHKFMFTIFALSEELSIIFLDFKRPFSKDSFYFLVVQAFLL